MNRTPNRTAQSGFFRAGSPNYLDLSSGGATFGMRTFAAAATADGWSTGDLVAVLVTRTTDATVFAVWIAAWDPTHTYLLLNTVETTSGALVDGDSVVVSAVLSSGMIKQVSAAPEVGSFVAQDTTARTLASSDTGKTICCTSSSATTITIPNSATTPLASGFHCVIVQEGAGLVTVAPSGTDTINGAASATSLSAQWKSAYLYQRSSGAWVILK